MATNKPGTVNLARPAHSSGGSSDVQADSVLDTLNSNEGPWNVFSKPTIRYSLPSLSGNETPTPDEKPNGFFENPGTTLRNLEVPSTTLAQSGSGDDLKMNSCNIPRSRSASAASESARSEFVTVKTIEDLVPDSDSTQGASSIDEGHKSDEEQDTTRSYVLRESEVRQWAIINRDLTKSPSQVSLETPAVIQDSDLSNIQDSLENATTRSVGGLLRDALVESKHKTGGDFVPDDQLQAILNRDLVYHLLRRTFKTESIAQVGKMSDAICNKSHKASRRRIFATLILIRKTRHIVSFLNNDITDDHLPLKRIARDWRENLVLRRIDHDTSSPLRCFASWKPEEMDAFCQTQLKTISPCLNVGGNELCFYRMRSNIILPFIRSDKKAYVGGYGTVCRVRIHPAHHNFDPWSSVNEHLSHLFGVGKHSQQREGAERDFALKEIQSESYEAFRDEVGVLERFSASRSGHPHLIRLLMALQHGNSYYLLFPWAQGNLVDLWSCSQASPSSAHDVQWLFSQCLGIAGGLKKIHRHISGEKRKQDEDNRHGSRRVTSFWEKSRGTHGDIKAENILYFEPPNKDKHLVISDFGLTRFNSTNSMPKPGGFSVTYRAPEFDLSAAVSQKCDIWSLGCLFLEFISWFLHGFQETRSERNQSSFQTSRIEDDIPYGRPFKEDKFFNLRPATSTENELHATVKDSVRTWMDMIRASTKSADAIADFVKLVQLHMLVPDAKSRESMDYIYMELKRIFDKCVDEEAYCVLNKRGTSSQKTIYAQPATGNTMPIQPVNTTENTIIHQNSNEGELERILAEIDSFQEPKARQLKNPKIDQQRSFHNGDDRMRSGTMHFSDGDDFYQLRPLDTSKDGNNQRHRSSLAAPPLQIQETTSQSLTTSFESYDDGVSSAITTRSASAVFSLRNSQEALRAADLQTEISDISQPCTPKSEATGVTQNARTSTEITTQIEQSDHHSLGSCRPRIIVDQRISTDKDISSPGSLPNDGQSAMASSTPSHELLVEYQISAHPLPSSSSQRMSPSSATLDQTHPSRRENKFLKVRKLGRKMRQAVRELLCS